MEYLAPVAVSEYISRSNATLAQTLTGKAENRYNTPQESFPVDYIFELRTILPGLASVTLSFSRTTCPETRVAR